MLVSNNLLIIFLAHQARFWSSRHVKDLSSRFFDLDIENSLGTGTLAEFELSLYSVYILHVATVATRTG
jgi:hypothetical protein